MTTETLSPPTEPTQEVDAGVIAEDARRRQQRHRRIPGAVTLGVVAICGLVVVQSRSSHATGNHNVPARPVVLDDGAFVTPKTPASLTVAPNGDLYVVDPGRDQILRRLQDGKFQVVAGTGSQGFSGDGGSAIKAKLRLGYYSGLAIAGNGTVYLSDSGNDRIRAVTRSGIIKTVAGGGTKPISDGSVDARDVQLATNQRFSEQLAGLAIGPNDELYFAVQTGVYLMTRKHILRHVVGSRVSPKDLTAWDANPGNPEDFLGATRIAYNEHGNLFVVSGGGGWGLYERAASGKLKFVHVLRGVVDGGGSGDGAIATDPDGKVITASNFGIEIADPAGHLPSIHG